MSAQETVVFYHLPKTAGTTLNHIIKKNYRPQDIVECGADTHAFVADFQTWPDEKRQSIRFLQGHYPFGLHQQLPLQTRHFTILRDPVERVISYYYHARRDTNHYLYDLIHDNNWSLKELLESGTALMMNDGQVRLLSAVWGDVDFDRMHPSMLQTAIENLRTCTIVGLTEQFDLTLLLLQHHFGWRELTYQRVNIGTNRQPIPAETVELVRHFNQFDQALYEEAQQLMRVQAEVISRFDVLRFHWQQHFLPYFYNLL